MGLTRKIEQNPFLKTVLPLAAGILVGQHVGLNIVVLWGLGAVLYALSWYRCGSRIAGFYLIATLFVGGAALERTFATQGNIPSDERLYLTMQITEPPFTEGRWQKTSAIVRYYRTENNSQWHSVEDKLILLLDTTERCTLGEQILCHGYVNKLDTAHRSYTRLMTRRGYTGQIFVVSGNLLARSRVSDQTLVLRARELQNAALQRINQLNLSPDSRAIASAMVAGDKRAIGKHLRENYSRMGASHLLAVSGLHVGIIFAFLNILLYVLPIFRRGHIWLNIAVICAIWVFAAMTGFSPSVVRSALMFSGAQIALAVSRKREPVNVMLGTAVIMLCINPNNLFDISFQLSFLAVTFIIMTFPPLYRMLQTQHIVPNIVISSLLIAVVATVGTLPMVSYSFGNLPLSGIILSPLLVALANVIVGVTILWVLMPLSILQGAVSGVLDWVITLQNSIIERCAQGILPVVEYRMTETATIVCYALLAVVAMWLWAYEPKQKFTIEDDDTK